MNPNPTAGNATRPRSAFIVIGAAALVVGLIAGAAAGYLVEKSRVESDVDRLQAKLADLRDRPRVDGRLAGRVTEASAGTLTVTGLDGRSVSVSTEGARIESSAAGTIDDLTEESKVLVHIRDTFRYGGFDVHEVVVLPATSRFGGAVSAIDGSEVTFNRPGDGSETIDVSANTYFFKATTATEVQPGATIVASGRTSGDRLAAEEVLVLPAGTQLEANGGST